MANWSNPLLTSTYTNFLTEVKDRDTDLALQFDGTTSTNIPTGTIRWNSTSNRWQKWSGTAWGELTTTYALTGLSTTGNASIGGTLNVTGVTTLGTATATTVATADNSTNIATTAFVKAQSYALLASPAFTGTPTAPTAANGTNTTQLATTAYVNSEIANDALLLTGGTLTGAMAAIAGTTGIPGVQVGVGTTYKPGIYSPGTDQLAIATAGTARLLVDAIGSVGVGVVPSNWNQGVNIDIGAASCIGNNGNLTQISNNRVLTSGVNYYKITGAASIYSAGAGQHVWYNAPSGTAGAAISFTQAMTLDANGNLGLGTTTPSSYVQNGGLAVYRNANNSQNHVVFANTSNLGSAAEVLTVASDTAGCSTVVTSSTWGNYGILKTASSTIYSTNFLAFGSTSGFIFGTGTSPYSEIARLDSSGNLGLGTVSAGKRLHLEVASVGNGIHISNSTNSYPAASTGYSDIRGTFYDYATGGSTLGGESIVRFGSENAFAGSRSSYIALMTSPPNGTGSATEKFRVDGGGNAGLGVVPAGWHSSYDAFQLNNRSALAGAAAGGTYLGNNWYNDGANKYIATDTAALYGQVSGQHAWYTAASGTAGAAIIFTQAMTLDASGRLGIGTTNPGSRLDVREAFSSSSIPLRIYGSSTGTGGAVYDIAHFLSDDAPSIRISEYNAGASSITGELTLSAGDGNVQVIGSTGPLAFKTGVANGTVGYPTTNEKVRIDSSGRFLVGTSSARANFFSGTIAAGLQVEGATSETTANRFASITYGGAQISGPLLILAKHRSASLGGSTLVQAGDEIGGISFQGAGGTNFIEGASIKAYTEGATASTISGRLVFLTSAASSNPVERLRIAPNGALSLGNTGTNFGTSGQALISQGTSGSPTWGSSVVTRTAVASTSGTAINFTSIPSWVERITVLFNAVSLSATANLLVQIGVSTGVETTGYASSCAYGGSSVDGGAASSTAGYVIRAGAAAAAIAGTLQICNVSGNIWVASFNGARVDGAVASSNSGGGVKTLAAVLDRVRITSTSTDTFDAGSINIFYE